MKPGKVLFGFFENEKKKSNLQDFKKICLLWLEKNRLYVL